MTTDEKRQLVVEIAKAYLGTFYRWGGDDPIGFDCSGLAIECLKSVGVLPRAGDWTAQGLYDFFPVKKTIPEVGDLFFWHGNDNYNRIVHVEIALDEVLAIGASGGGSNTTTIEDAIKQNAFIKIRPIYSRPHCRGAVNPYADIPNLGHIV